MNTNLVRSTDPESSKQAATEVVAKGLQKTQQIAAITMLARHGEGTREELAKAHAIEVHNGPRSAYSHDIVDAITHKTKIMLGRRLPELAESGLITRTGIRQCKVAKRACTVWRITPIGLEAVLATEEAETPCKAQKADVNT